MNIYILKMEKEKEHLNQTMKFKKINEFIHFFYFNQSLFQKRNNKKIIINRLRQHNDTIDRNLNDFKTKFYILNNLLIVLLQDRFVSIINKIFFINYSNNQ